MPTARNGRHPTRDRSTITYPVTGHTGDIPLTFNLFAVRNSG